MRIVKKLAGNWPIFGVVLVASCITPPKHTICILNGDGTAWCTPPDDGEQYKLEASQLENFVARSIDDEKMLIEWGKRNCHGPK